MACIREESTIICQSEDRVFGALALKEAESRLAERIGLAANGEEVIITKKDGSGFKTIPFSNEWPYPKFGSAAGLFEMSDDFDEPLDDFKEYMPVS